MTPEGRMESGLTLEERIFSAMCAGFSQPWDHDSPSRRYMRRLARRIAKMELEEPPMTPEGRMSNERQAAITEALRVVEAIEIPSTLDTYSDGVVEEYAREVLTALRALLPVVQEPTIYHHYDSRTKTVACGAVRERGNTMPEWNHVDCAACLATRR